MYEPGLLKVLDPPCSTMDSEGLCDDFEHKHELTDSRSDVDYVIPDFCVYLPHSCNEWIIGGKEEVEALIRDLQAVIDNVR